MTSPKQPDAPGTITAGFWLVVVGMAFVVLTSVYLWVNRQVLVDAQVKAGLNPEFTPDQVASAVNVVLLVALGVNVLLAAIAVLLGNRVRQGVRKSRTGLFITLMIALFFQLVVDNLLGLVVVVIALGGLAMMFFRQSSEYLTREQAL
ncbi:hypothetical protein [Nocardia sp. NRRL S-836]|uniref:hypothetical protein n=1 Tax=Nocardia sp. NRRL S-836 TaxID=1519492 RepID=UPI0006AF3F9E|nr:hypothetical protein [Nocardia sp. NRRL S-836]KOV80907.1 hypothetical protein ADL03_30730 [Nocardia sp. NRRL S-836]